MLTFDHPSTSYQDYLTQRADSPYQKLQMEWSLSKLTVNQREKKKKETTKNFLMSKKELKLNKSASKKSQPTK